MWTTRSTSSKPPGLGGVLGRRATPAYGPFRRFLASFYSLLFLHHLIPARQSSRGHPGRRLSPHRTPDGVSSASYFLSSECFADFISRLDLSGKRVVDVGTGSGILALAAARAGCRKRHGNRHRNPNAAFAAAENARANGLGDRVNALCSDLLPGAGAPAAIRRDPVEPTQACRANHAISPIAAGMPAQIIAT